MRDERRRRESATDDDDDDDDDDSTTTHTHTQQHKNTCFKYILQNKYRRRRRRGKEQTPLPTQKNVFLIGLRSNVTIILVSFRSYFTRSCVLVEAERALESFVTLSFSFEIDTLNILLHFCPHQKESLIVIVVSVSEERVRRTQQQQQQQQQQHGHHRRLRQRQVRRRRAGLWSFFHLFHLVSTKRERERDREPNFDRFFSRGSLSLSLCPIIKFPRRVYDARERSFPALRSRKRETTT